MERISRRFSSSNNQNRNHEFLDVSLDKNNESKEHKLSQPLLRKYKGLMFILVIFFIVLWFVFQANVASKSTYALKSKSCNIPVAGKPLVQHVIIIDAGSTGSRIHLYKFNNCHNTPSLEDEVFEQIKPGLSSYENPQKAADSLDTLLKTAVNKISKSQQKCTPIMVKATAGLRLLGKDKSEKILEAIKEKMKSYPFKVLDRKTDGISIMDGDLEGVYAWITVNYLLGNLDSSKKFKSVATLDLGGGSTQIVFEPKYSGGDSELIMPFRYELELGTTKHILYQFSYLGFGLMEARKKIKQQAISQAAANTVQIPCLAKDKNEAIDYDGSSYVLLGTAQSLNKCQELVRKVFNFDKICSYKQCSFDGVYQPNITETFPNNDIYAFSYFYDRLEPLGLSQRYNIDQIKTVAQNVCSGNYKYFEKVPNAIDELQNNPNRCLDLTFIYTLLSSGYGISESRNINTEKKINGYETGWCLGAAVTSLGELDACSSDNE